MAVLVLLPVIALFILVIAGLKIFLGPLGVLGDVIPLIGSIIRIGTGFIATVVGRALGTLTIAVAWLFYRILLGNRPRRHRHRLAMTNGS